jgi:hypothetical protein
MRSRNCALRAMNLPSLQVRPRNSHHQPATPWSSQRNQESNSRQNAEFASFAFNSLRTLFPAPKLQPSSFHGFPYSLTDGKNITHAFPVTSALFVRSSAQERKSTPLFSCIPARFCRYVGVSQRNSECRAKVPGRLGRGEYCRVNLQSSPPEGKLAP